MKKFKLLSIIVVGIFLVFLIIIKFSEKPKDVLQKHLKKRYSKEFVIYYSGNRNDGRNSWFEAEIYPKELVGTIREYDKYYWAKGFVENGKGGDTYGGVLLNESANKFYLPKLKELFGENVLPIFNTDVGRLAIKPDFYTTLKESKEENRILELKGGIYIFGRVENDEDREKYREEIYKFLSFMKETGTFEYVDLDILVIDERILLDEFKNNTIGTLTELNEINEKYVSEDEFLEKREKIMNKLNIYFDENKYYKSNIDEINRNNLRKDGAAIYTRGNNLLYLKAYSPKYIKSQKLDNREIREYNSISDVKFDWERWQ